MSRLAWLFGGGIAWIAWRRIRTRGASTSPTPHTLPPAPTSLPGRWVWPVPQWIGRTPVISDGFDSPRPDVPRHGGVDIMFGRLANDSFKVGSPNSSAHFVMPDGVVAVAACDGVVKSASLSPRGFAVVIDHAPIHAATFYTHLEKLLVRPTTSTQSDERVRAGQPIGVIGADPLDGEHLKHLHFELWPGGGPESRVDPARLMRTWDVVAAPSATAPRSASLVFRPIGATGDA